MNMGDDFDPAIHEFDPKTHPVHPLFICPVCDERFWTIQGLDQHKIQHHFSSTAPVDADASAPSIAAPLDLTSKLTLLSRQLDRLQELLSEIKGIL